MDTKLEWEVEMDVEGSVDMSSSEGMVSDERD